MLSREYTWAKTTAHRGEAVLARRNARMCTVNCGGKQPRFASARCATRAVGCQSIKVSTGRGVPHSCAVVFAQVYSRLNMPNNYSLLRETESLLKHRTFRTQFIEANSCLNVNKNGMRKLKYVKPYVQTDIPFMNMPPWYVYLVCGNDFLDNHLEPINS